MADGSVVIGVSLDTSAFAAQSAALETQLSGLGERLNASLNASLTGDGLAASLGSALTGVSEALAGTVQSVTDAMRNAASAASAEFANAGWAAAGSSAMSALAGGVTAGGAHVTNASRQIAGQAYAAFTSGGWSSVGAEMMNGVASGILAAGASVAAAIRQVSAEAESAVKEYYRISSPSGLMRDEVGVMISRGIAEGILDGASFVGGAMSAVYGDPIPGGSAASGSFGSAAGSAGISGAAGRGMIQNIYLRDSDSSPYRTAKRIRRESEAIFR